MCGVLLVNVILSHKFVYVEWRRSRKVQWTNGKVRCWDHYEHNSLFPFMVLNERIYFGTPFRATWKLWQMYHSFEWRTSFISPSYIQYPLYSQMICPQLSVYCSTIIRYPYRNIDSCRLIEFQWVKRIHSRYVLCERLPLTDSFRSFNIECDWSVCPTVDSSWWVQDTAWSDSTTKAGCCYEATPIRWRWCYLWRFYMSQSCFVALLRLLSSVASYACWREPPWATADVAAQQLQTSHCEQIRLVINCEITLFPVAEIPLLSILLLLFVVLKCLYKHWWERKHRNWIQEIPIEWNHDRWIDDSLDNYFL